MTCTCTVAAQRERGEVKNQEPLALLRSLLRRRGRQLLKKSKSHPWLSGTMYQNLTHYCKSCRRLKIEATLSDRLGKCVFNRRLCPLFAAHSDKWFVRASCFCTREFACLGLCDSFGLLFTQNITSFFERAISFVLFGNYLLGLGTHC